MSRDAGSGVARDGDGDREVVEIVVDGGYHPAHVSVAAGRPLRLIFRRQEDSPCSERVIFSAPRFERRLAAMATTVIDLPAPSGPEIRFTCSMGRYRGRIAVVGATIGGDRPRPSLRPSPSAGLLALVLLLAAVAALTFAAGASSAAMLTLVLAAFVAVSIVLVGRRAAAALGRASQEVPRALRHRR